MSEVVDTDTSYDETESESESFDTFTGTESLSDNAFKEDIPRKVKAAVKRSDLEDSLHEKNREIASTLKSITVNNLTPNTKRKLTQQEEIQRADAMRDTKPDWLKQATKRRASTIREMEQSRNKNQAPSESSQPEWVQKAKEAQISRDLRGLDRFLNKKAPALPPEPEWLSKACKRRDLTQLLATPEKVHVSNVEAPLWVQSSAAQKILNSFLQEDEGVIPDWMKQGVKMSSKEKTLLLEQLEKLKSLLEEEKKLTAERETFLASTKDAMPVAEQKLEESIASYRTLRENRKGEDVQGFIDSSNEVFRKNEAYMNSLKTKFDLEEMVSDIVASQKEKEDIKRKERENTKKTRRKKSKTKKKTKKSSRNPNVDSSNDEIKQNLLEIALEREGGENTRKKKRSKDKTHPEGKSPKPKRKTSKSVPKEDRTEEKKKRSKK